MKTIDKKIIFIIATLIAISIFSIMIVSSANATTTYVAKTYIDYPASSSIGGNIIVEGWVMTNDTESTIKAYIDGKETQILSQTRKERGDVLQAIQGYGTAEQNKQPGYKLTLNCSNLTTGKHNVLIRVISRDNKTLAEHQTSFTYEEANALIWLDSLIDNNAISGDYNISGWVMSNDANATIKVYINDKEQSGINRVSRADVLEQIQGYGTKRENPNPGFQYTIKGSNLTDGTYTLKIVVLSGKGQTIAQYTKNIIVQKYKAKTYIEHPTSNYVWGNIIVEGWVMTNDTNSQLKLYVDGQDATIISQSRSYRDDVIKAIQGYGTSEQNKQPGFKYVLNCANLSKGNHTLSLKVISRENKVISEYKTNFTYEPKSILWIDSPLDTNNVISGNYNLYGWTMTNDANATVKLYINNQEQTGLKRETRQDVIEQIQGYGTRRENPNPGFQYTINCSNYVDGTYTLKIVVLSAKGETLAQYTKDIIIQKYTAKTYIDYPTSALAGNFEFDAWMITNDEKATYKLYIDNIEQTNLNFKRIQRADVLNAYKEYKIGDINNTPGIKCDIDTTNLSKGQHNISLKVFSREGKEIAQYTETFTLEESKAKIYIDEPADTNKDIVNSNLKVKGWIMSNDKNISFKTFIDGKEQTLKNLKRTTRDDVIKAITEYGTKKENPNPGYEFELDLSGFSNGEHSIKIEVYSGKETLIATQEQKFILDKYLVKMNIETPTQNQQISTTMKVEGWIMSAGTNSNIKIYIDNQQITNAEIIRKERGDVISAITGYGTIKENPTPGFKAIIDTSKYKDGKHTLKVVAVVNNEETTTIVTRDFTIKKYKTASYIDEPSQSATREDQITIRGWVMSELSNKKVIIKIDDNEIGNITYQARPDVISAITGYGTINENPTPEFKTTVDISSYAKGTHTIKIQVYANETDEIIHEQTKTIVFQSKIARETLTYGYSGAYLNGKSGGSELICYKFGDGPNVLFATFCVHGYEDSWARDGGFLVTVAENFYNRLIQEQDYSLAEKWTIYIFPEVNPDGRRLGTSNNGPGRTTLYSMVSKGIDINRSWQTGSSYERYTSNRNYNGTAGFQAYEAKYLRDFILTHKTNIGQNVLIDLHGWEDQLIGDASICKYYKTQYPSCKTTNYGKYGTQYLISWARLNIGAKVALVELPLASSLAQAQSRGLSDKYINATLNLLREM